MKPYICISAFPGDAETFDKNGKRFTAMVLKGMVVNLADWKGQAYTKMGLVMPFELPTEKVEKVEIETKEENAPKKRSKKSNDTQES